MCPALCSTTLEEAISRCLRNIDNVKMPHMTWRLSLDCASPRAPSVVKVHPAREGSD